MTTFLSLHQAPAMVLTGWGWVLIFLLVVAVLVLVLWWATQFTPQDAYTPKGGHGGGHGEAHTSHAPVQAAAAPPATPDNLKKIEGIGPKTEHILKQHGILTFAQLAETPVETLQAILDEAGFRLGAPGTWAEQAALAAKGEWEALEKLQDELKGGRRI